MIKTNELFKIIIIFLLGFTLFKSYVHNKERVTFNGAVYERK